MVAAISLLLRRNHRPRFPTQGSSNVLGIGNNGFLTTIFEDANDCFGEVVAIGQCASNTRT